MSASLNDVDIFIFSRKVILFPCEFFQHIQIGLTFTDDFIQPFDIVTIVLYTVILATYLFFAFQILGNSIS